MGDWEIKYLAHYDVPDANRKRVINLAAANKLDYILRTLSKLNIKTTVISASNTYGEEAYPSFCEKIYDNITLKLLPTMKRRNKVMRIIAGIIFRLRLIITLLKEVKKGDTLVVKSLDRLSRNKMDIKNEVQFFKEHGIRLKVIDLPTTMMDLPEGQEWVFDMVNNILIEVLGTIAEQERETTHQRQEALHWKSGEITGKVAMEKTKTKRTSFYKLVQMTETK